MFKTVRLKHISWIEATEIVRELLTADTIAEAAREMQCEFRAERCLSRARHSASATRGWLDEEDRRCPY
jgi:hypothetical protein